MQKRSAWMSVVVGLLVSTTAWAQQRPGKIVVDSGSAKGEIVLDGFPTGIMAPTTLESVPPGEHVIEVEYGCMFATGTAQVRTEETVTAHMTVENRGGTGTIRVRGLPRGAEVYIDNAPSDALGLEDGSEVKCGARRVRVESPGFEAWEDLVVVTSGKWSTVEPELVQAEIVEEPRYVEREVPRYEEPEYDDLSDLDAEYDMDDPIDAARRAEEERRRQAEEETRRAQEEARRRAEEERMARFGDIDSLDEPVVEESGRRGRDRDDEDARDELDELDGFGDEEEYEDEYEDEYDDEYDEVDDYDRYGDLDEEPSGRRGRSEKPDDRLDAGSRNSKQREGKPFPVRGAGVVGGVAVAGAGVGLVAVGTSRLNAYQPSYDVLVGNDPLSPEAININNTQLKPARQIRGLGFGLTGVGVAAGVVSYFLIPPAWNTQLVVAPEKDGGGIAVLTVEF